MQLEFETIADGAGSGWPGYVLAIPCILGGPGPGIRHSLPPGGEGGPFHRNKCPNRISGPANRVQSPRTMLPRVPALRRILLLLAVPSATQKNCPQVHALPGNHQLRQNHAAGLLSTD